MTWRTWLAMWGIALIITGIFAALTYAIGWYALPIVFTLIIVVGGLIVTRQ